MRATAVFRRRTCGSGSDSGPTVYIVDDRADDRDRLRAMVESIDLDTATFSNARDFLAARVPAQPGCLVLDLRMPGMDGLELQAELASRGDDLPIIFVTAYAEVPAAVQAMRAGAVDFMSKPVCEHDLLRVVRTAIALDTERRQRRSKAREGARRLATLSAREREVLELVLQGKSSKGIADILSISARTVDVHRSHIIHKMGATCLPDLYRLVYGTEPSTQLPIITQDNA
ncbi:MAG: response regulator [Phycisphaerales bacterium]|nr:response regulator [Phycisphaerales bacterium]